MVLSRTLPEMCQEDLLINLDFFADLPMAPVKLGEIKIGDLLISPPGKSVEGTIYLVLGEISAPASWGQEYTQYVQTCKAFNLQRQECQICHLYFYSRGSICLGYQRLIPSEDQAYRDLLAEACSTP